MKLPLIILLFTLLVFNKPSTEARPLALRKHSWAIPVQEFRQERLIKRKGQPGWGKRSDNDIDDDRPLSLDDDFVRNWLEDQ